MKTIKKMIYQNLKSEEIREGAGAFVMTSVVMMLVYGIIWFAYIVG